MQKLIVNILDEREDTSKIIPTELITKVLEEAYKDRGEIDGSVNVMFIGDSQIAEMNESYLAHVGPTDVISFEDGDVEEDVLLLGDIAVSSDTALRVGKEKGMSYEEELTLYSLHGLLHLLGLDDTTDELLEEMMSAQEAEFSKHGLNYIK